MNKPTHIHAEDLEEGAMEQFNHCMEQDFVIEGALMPDAHQGYVAPIGAVIKTEDAVIPAWVGYDIGCGMIAIKISEDPDIQDLIIDNSEDIFNQINREIPMGAGKHNTPNSPVSTKTTEAIKGHLIMLKQELAFIDNTEEEIYNTVEILTPRNIGTLGSGNHFIEILTNNDETWLVIHSGSRGVGHTIATYFMKKVSGVDKGFEATHNLTDESMRDEYMAYQDYCLQFALLNRMEMAYKVEAVIGLITGFEYDTDENLWANKNHNHCVQNDDGTYTHRKGATTSDEGELGVIPANMRDGCFLVKGKGNPEFLNSSSHGAGRAMSRGQARKKITMEKFQQDMEGIMAPVKEKVIDEAPDAYKNITKVMELQKDSVDIVAHLTPIINWKGF